MLAEKQPFQRLIAIAALVEQIGAGAETFRASA
jgi:hypothetical protein